MSNPRNKDRSYNTLQAAPYLSCCIPTTFWYPLDSRMPLFSAGAATLVIISNCTGPDTVSLLCAGLWMCTFLAELAATSRCPGRLSWCCCCSSLSWSWALLPGHFPGFQATFDYTWPVKGSVRSLWDKEEHPHPVPRARMGTRTQLTTCPRLQQPPVKAHHSKCSSPQPLPEPKAPAIPGS